MNLHAWLEGTSTATKITIRSLYENHFQHQIQESEDPGQLVRIWLESELGPATIKKLFTIYREWHRQTYGTEATIKRATRRMFRQQTTELVVWSKEEAARALDCARTTDRKIYLPILFALHTGTRKSEMFNVCWDRDVDFLQSKVHIRHTKTGKPRSLPLSKTLEDALTKRYTVGCEGPVFKRFEPNYRLRHLCKRADVPSITWHDLRHSFATWALESGVSPKVVQTLLGHETLSTTINIYWNCIKQSCDFEFLEGIV